jgi:hypothetical protein
VRDPLLRHVEQIRIDHCRIALHLHQAVVGQRLVAELVTRSSEWNSAHRAPPPKLRELVEALVGKRFVPNSQHSSTAARRTT